MENVCTEFEKDPVRNAHVRVLTVKRPMTRQSSPVHQISAINADFRHFSANLAEIREVNAEKMRNLNFCGEIAEEMRRFCGLLGLRQIWKRRNSGEWDLGKFCCGEI